MDRSKYGFKVRSQALQRILENEVVVSQGTSAIIHHATDTKDGLQLEVEYRHPVASAIGGQALHFARVVLKE